MIEKLIYALHFPVTPLKPYSNAHILLLAAGLSVIVPAAKYASKCTLKAFRRLIFGVGLILNVLELLKQIYYTVIRGGGKYDLSLLPLQLCSMPLYLCFLYLALKNDRVKNAIACFLSTFTLMGGLCALIVPVELFTPFLFITIQAVTWHFALVFLGLSFAMRFSYTFTRRTFYAASVFFFLQCLTALLLNSLLDPFSATPMRLYFIGKNSPGIPILEQIYRRCGWFVSSAAMILSELFGGYFLYILVKGIPKRIHPEIKHISG